MFTLLVIYFNPPRQNKPKQIAGTAFHPKKRIPPHITRGILSANLLSILPVLSRYHSRPRGLFQIPTGLSKFPQAFQTDAGLSKPSQAIPDPRRFFRFPQTFPGPRWPFPASHRLSQSPQDSSILPQPPDTEFSALKHINLTVILLYNDP